MPEPVYEIDGKVYRRPRSGAVTFSSPAVIDTLPRGTYGYFAVLGSAGWTQAVKAADGWFLDGLWPAVPAPVDAIFTALNLELVDDSLQVPEPQHVTAATTEEAAKLLDELPLGTVVCDDDGTLWVRANGPDTREGYRWTELVPGDQTSAEPRAKSTTILWMSQHGPHVCILGSMTPYAGPESE